MRARSDSNSTSSVASNYFNLVKLDKFIENQEKLVKLQTEIVKLEDIKYSEYLEEMKK